MSKQTHPKKINFSFGIHNHQPVGNFEYIFEQSYQKGYLPFLKLLKRFPFFKISLHYSGILLNWIKENHPEALELMKSFIQEGQVELLTGSFYESILPVIPDRDKIGQIEKLNFFIQDQFEFKPVGMWLAERVWEPHLPKILSSAGIKFVILDDTHFKYSGLSENQLSGYYITEEQGHTVNLFPISKTLRYAIPFEEPEKIVNYLKEKASEDGGNLLVYADDGEKFGIWPGTYKHCYEDKWIERFLEEMENNQGWINFLHFSEVLKTIPPKGRVYLPTASYAEMSQWTLLPSAFREYEELENKLKAENLYSEFGIFVRGGFWRNFLAKYPESNHLHKKMLTLSYRIKELESVDKIDKDKLSLAQEKLWKGQCNDPYWHGVFGGLYLTNLRSAVYSHLIGCDKLLGEITHKDNNWIDCQIEDFDKDGKDEIVIGSSNLNLCFLPHSGGSLVELDYKPKSLNLLDILSRREEGYHQKIRELSRGVQLNTPTKNSDQVASIHDLVLTKEEGLDKYLTYDWYRRGGLIDHFLGKHTKLADFERCQYPEQGDFANQSYQFEVKKDKDKLVLTLFRDGWVWVGDQRAQISLAKKILISSDCPDLEFNYIIKNNHNNGVDLWFGMEFNFGLLSTEGDKYFYLSEGTASGGKEKGLKKSLSDSDSDEDVAGFGIKDNDLGLEINLKIDKPATLWRFPLFCVSLSESGFEKNYQSSVFLLNWKMRLKPKEVWEIKIVQRIKQIKRMAGMD